MFCSFLNISNTSILDNSKLLSTLMAIHTRCPDTTYCFSMWCIDFSAFCYASNNGCMFINSSNNAEDLWVLALAVTPSETLFYFTGILVQMSLLWPQANSILHIHLFIVCLQWEHYFWKSGTGNAWVREGFSFILYLWFP